MPIYRLALKLLRKFRERFRKKTGFIFENPDTKRISWDKKILTWAHNQFLFSVAHSWSATPRAFKVGSKPLAFNLCHHGQACFFLSIWSSFCSRGSGLYEFHAHCRWSRLVQCHDSNHWYCLSADSSISETLAMVCHPFMGCVIGIGGLFTMVRCQRSLPQVSCCPIRTADLETLS